MSTDDIFSNAMKSFAKHYVNLTKCDFLVPTDVKRVKTPYF